jgi:hypothetical protein
MVKLRKKKISESKIAKALTRTFLKVSYRLFFMVALLWLVLACVAYDMGLNLYDSLMCGALAFASLMMSVLMFELADDGKDPPP